MGKEQWKITKSEQKREKRSLKEDNSDNLRDIVDNIKHPNICVLEIPGEDRKGQKNFFDEIMAKNLSNLPKGYPGIGSTENPK